MSKPKYAARVDLNQNEIVKSLRDIPGVSVELDHDDILVGYEGKTYWFELKGRKHTEIKPSQVKILKTWTGHYQIVYSLEEILKIILPENPGCN